MLPISERLGVSHPKGPRILATWINPALAVKAMHLNRLRPHSSLDGRTRDEAYFIPVPQEERHLAAA